MAQPRYTRRHCLQLTAATAAATLLRAQTHTNVATVEHDRVLAEAKQALTAPIVPVTAAKPPQPLPANTFFSETEPDTPGQPAFRAHADALRRLSATVACLAAAYLLTHDETYARNAAEHVRVSLLALKSTFDYAGCAPDTQKPTPNGILDLIPLAELARALAFLVDSPALTDADQLHLQQWFKATAGWLNDTHVAEIARDKPDRRGSAFLLLATAFARYTRDEPALEACRKLFRTPTLRHQIRADGVFPQEVATANPYRNTLFNFDLLAGACQLLSSPFDQLWTYELIDGVGLRAVAAYLYPLIAHPERWPFVSDAVGFRELPGRRPALLFTGHAYNRPEYIELWQQLPPAIPPDPALAATFPIRQPLLWTTRAPHGL